MPTLNRRHFLQASAAAGLAPALPALPVAAARTATPAQMLWASLIARAGNAGSASQVASAMGIPKHVAHGVFTKLMQSNVVAAQSLSGLNRMASVQQSAISRARPKAPSIRAHLERFWTEDTDADHGVEEQTEIEPSLDHPESDIEQQSP